MEALLLKNHSFTRINSEKDKYYDIPLIYQLSYALSEFYDLPKDSIKAVPHNWNPVFLFYTTGLFDPDLMGPEGTIREELWEPWPDVVGIANTIRHANSIKEFVKKNTQHIDVRPLNLGERGWPTILHNHFVITREVVTNKTVIIGFYHLETGRFRRYLIKDVKKLCRTLRVNKGDYPRLLGRLDKDEIGKFYPKVQTRDEFEKEVFSLVKNASRIPIKCEHVNELVKALKATEGSIIAFPNTLK